MQVNTSPSSRLPKPVPLLKQLSKHFRTSSHELPLSPTGSVIARGLPMSSRRATSDSVLIESPRSKLYDTLLEIGFRFTQLPDVKGLSSNERRSLKRMLQRYVDSHMEQTTEKDAIPNIKRLLAHIESVQMDVRIKRLLTRIHKNEEDIWELLAVDHLSLLSTDLLFSNIYAEIFPPGGDAPTPAMAEKMIAFCCEWAKVNRFTKAFEEAYPHLNLIFAATTKSSDAKICELAKKLEGLCRQEPQLAAPIALKGSYLLTDMIFKEAALGSIKQEVIAKLAQDLTIYQMTLFEGLNTNDFMTKKWIHKKSPRLLAHEEISNKLGSWALEKLLTEPKLYRLFFLLAKHCMVQNDFASMFALGIILVNSQLEKQLTPKERSSRGTRVFWRPLFPFAKV